MPAQRNRLRHPLHGRRIRRRHGTTWGVTSELTGLTELEACLDNKDFEHCSSLAADVLIGAKLKALEKAYDGLKLLKRGCEVAGKAGMRTMSARSADVPCLTHNVPGLPRDKSKIPDSTDCGACAKRIRDSLGGEARS
ncbi:hypothetical protein ACFVY9_05245 [Streptomyces sp. NPDC059544]|uniref:hypothetical protein n=1 Tax=Streptomyces sp. NPDC059544 TaxID=3346861 RepID=UPI0036844A3D